MSLRPGIHQHGVVRAEYLQELIAAAGRHAEGLGVGDQAVGGHNVVGVRGSYKRDLSVDRDSSGFVDTDLRALDEVREVGLEERLPRPALRVAERGARFGCRLGK